MQALDDSTVSARRPRVWRRLAGGLGVLPLVVGAAAAQTDYPLTADSRPQAGVPAGTVEERSLTSAVFPGTVRDYWVYVPAAYRAGTPAAVMVFQDGAGYVREDGRWRAPVVFDNLIHRGEMPVTIGVFVDPGVLPAAGDDRQARFNRSFEYDSLGDRYARFLLEELLPEVGRTWSLTANPDLRAIGGSSSGGSCAFTVAWNRPDAFRRVLSFIGSFTGLRGAEAYPTLIRKTEPQPLRVYLQDGSRDLDIYSGSWWLANQAMASALAYAGYDHVFVTGDQGHNNVHGSALLPDALRWLWRDWESPLAPSRGRPGAERHWVTEILDPGRGWEAIYRGGEPLGGLAGDAGGDVLVGEPDRGRVLRIAHADGRVAEVRRDASGVRALAVAADGRLLAALPGRVVAFGAEGEPTVLAVLEAGSLVTTAGGPILAAEAPGGRIRLLGGPGGDRVVLEGAEPASALGLSPDQSLLTVAAPSTRWVWSHRLAADGTLAHGEPFYRLETRDDPSAPGGAALTVDAEGWLYVATRLGIQVCDQPGRVAAILANPEGRPPSGLAFGGPARDTLYATAGETLYRRKLRRRGVGPGRPEKPPRPRL